MQQNNELKQLRLGGGDSIDAYKAALKQRWRAAVAKRKSSPVEHAILCWQDAALQTFRRFLKRYGLDDGVTLRPSEWTALRNLEMLARHPHVVAPLSSLEQEVLLLETYYLANYDQRDFQRRYGYHLARDDRFSWIASRIPGLARLQVRAMLDDISYTLDALRWQTEVDEIKAGLSQEYGEFGMIERLNDSVEELPLTA